MEDPQKFTILPLKKLRKIQNLKVNDVSSESLNICLENTEASYPITYSWIQKKYKEKKKSPFASFHFDQFFLSNISNRM